MADGSVRLARRLRVLVADDNRDAAETLAWLVSAARHRVRRRMTGRVALQIAMSGWPTWPFSTSRCLSWNGYDVAAAVRSASSGPPATDPHCTDGVGRSPLSGRSAPRAAGFDRLPN